MDTVSTAMGKRSVMRRNPQDLIAELLQKEPSPNEQVAARWPADAELGQLNQADYDRYVKSINGPEGLPNFNWVNPAGVEAFLEHSPESVNIEDRRPDIDAFIRSALAR
jgi:hypothetical protein